ncbi:hypothetical protein B296_00034878, partial [Ensete ventricosum]
PSNLAFSTTKRMGEVEYPSSLTYVAQELYISSVVIIVPLLVSVLAVMKALSFILCRVFLSNLCLT